LGVNAFRRYELRTTDEDGARDFYTALFGGDFVGDSIAIQPLPAAAAARGAPAHWLGQLEVEDVVGTALRLVEAGGTALGPPLPARSDGPIVVRDPFGAMVALASGMRGTSTRVAWHLLSTRDEVESFALYSDLFRWRAVDTLDLGPERGRHVTFAWNGGGAVGSTSDLARRPHVHPQWLFFFVTDDLDAALSKVRTLGGLTLPPARTATGDRAAACDDPQGAAFGLYQSRRR
jgi:hypothetical protein